MPVVFNTRDEHLHKQLRSPIASLYSMTNVLALEPFVDKTLSVLFEQLDSRFVKTQCEFDLGDWLQYFAFEVRGTLSFSKQYGFLEHGCDTNGLLESIWAFMKRVAPVCLAIVGFYICEGADYCRWAKFPGLTRSGIRIGLWHCSEAQPGCLS